MERGKGSQGRGKPKAQHFPSDLFVLGSKSSGSDSSKRPIPAASGERKRDGAPSGSIPLLPSKKAKTVVGGSSGLGRASTGSPTTCGGIDLWETQTVDVEPLELVPSVLDCYQTNQLEKAAQTICGGLKTLKNTKWKPDSIITMGLINLAKLRPSLYASELVTQALNVMLKRDPQHNFKSKGNPLVAVLAANLLCRGYLDSKHWPTTFIKLYVEDAMAERVWVDQAECKGFVNNVLTGFGTKLPPANINLLVPEMGPLGITRSESPLTICLDEEDDAVAGSGLSDIPVFPRFSKSLDAVEQIVLDLIGNRRQTPESVTRNYLKLLASAAGILEIRVLAAPRLEMWLQNPKLMKPAQELLLSICVNCVTHSAKDIQVIGALVKIRLKTKALINFYLACVRELISAHPDNISTVLKHIIYNELSSSRNPNNMSMIGVVFQCQPEQAAVLLAEVFLELLMNRDDYLRPLRVLLREIVRVLRHDFNLLALCRGLMADKRDLPAFREFELKERMFCAIIDLLAHACFLGVSPAVKESVNLAARGDKRELQTLVSFHTMVATIEQEAVVWLKDHALKIYRPSPIEFVHALHKIVFMDNQEAYYKVDSWPPESERALMLRLAAESPLYETTLYNILVIGVSKDHPVSGLDALELADQLVKRSAALSSDTVVMLAATKMELFDLCLKIAAYHHPDNISLPPGYAPPQLAIGNCYWKAWVMMLILSAHNPGTLGEHAWEKYPTLRMLMEMCITNHFSYPPPTMQNENQEESKAIEARMTQMERESILEFEKHLAAASSKATITEATSLLLPQLITMDPFGPVRKPPLLVLEQLSALNATHRLGHLLCRSRHPDFLLDLIQRQGASQSMPWLADLVENSESSLSHLPVQCLCEFLLTSGPPDKQSKGQQLVAHLQHVLTDPDQEPTAPCEVMEYLLRRLSSAHMNSRMQAIKGLKLVLAANGADKKEMADYLQESAWLLHQLPNLPHFSAMRPQVVAALRQACQVENDPACIASYIQFLAIHTGSDSLNAMCLLVQDMAQLIVERSTIMNAIMPDGSRDLLRANTLHSLMIIFYSYLSKAKMPRGNSYAWSDSPDQVLVQWSNGDEATFHILVVNAMIILLSYGPCRDLDLFNHLLDAWFPANGDLPKAYLVDTSEEALLIPDWLKLRMIRSGVERLVDAGLADLGAKQLVLFMQSFGIPVSSMRSDALASGIVDVDEWLPHTASQLEALRDPYSTENRLLETIDNADPQQIAAANFDKNYMVQLVHVQGRRGAIGGQRFIQELRLPDPALNAPAFKKTIPKTQLVLPPSGVAPPICSGKFQLHMVSVLFNDIFSVSETRDNRRDNFKKLQKMLLVDAKTHEEKVQGISMLLQHLMTTMKSHDSLSALIRVLEDDPGNSTLTLRLMWTLLQPLPESFQKEFAGYMQQVGGMIRTQDAALLTLMKHITGGSSSTGGSFRDSVPNIDAVRVMLEGKDETIGRAIDHLVSSEPELIGPNTETEMRMLLFGKPVKTESAICVVEACRPYLLTLLAHRASWERLQTLVDHLLCRFEKFYSPTPVLDFLEALTRNPRLWQGREKHVPKHQVPEPVLNLTEGQVICMIEYIIEEAEEVKPDGNSNAERPSFLGKLEGRMPLLLEPLHTDFFPNVVKKIARFIQEFPPERSNVCKHLLVLLYYHVPGLIQYLYGTEEEALLKSAVISGWSSSTLDKVSHTLLTALTLTNTDSKDWTKRSQDYEVAARKMAVVHPALVLRQLPMVAASLHGRVHLEYHVLRKRNHINVFFQVLGLVDLLQPLIFAKEHAQPLQLVLDAYLTLFQLHGHMKDVMVMMAKFVALLQNYVVNDANAASKYLQANAQALTAIQRIHPNMTPLRSLLSGILTMRDEPGDDNEGPQSSMVVTTPVEFVTQPPGPIVAAITHANGEDLLPALLELDHISLRNPAVLEVVADQISNLLLSPYSNIRSLAHTLLARLLKHNPQCNVITGYLRCLESDQGDVILSALEKLPEIAVNAQEQAIVLLEKAFSLGVRTSLNTYSYINKAIALLNQQKGC